LVELRNKIIKEIEKELSNILKININRRN